MAEFSLKVWDTYNAIHQPIDWTTTTVEADYVEVLDCGALVFWIGGWMGRIFAPGEWRNVKRLEEEDAQI